MGNSLFTIALVSVVFRQRDFHFKIYLVRHKKEVKCQKDVYVVASHAFQQDRWTLTLF